MIIDADVSSYKEQLERVQRWLDRIEVQGWDRIEYRDGFKEFLDRIQYEDFLWTFFQNCWHLKDWIKNDDALPRNVCETVEDEVKKFESLMICADLANRSKHLELKNIRRDARAIAEIRLVVGESKISRDYMVVLADGSKHPALDVARNAMKDWRTLLSDYGLV